MAFTPILSSQSVYATDQSGFRDFESGFFSFIPRFSSPDGVESGEPLLDGVGRPRRLAVGVSDAHLGRLRVKANTQAH